MWIKQYSKVYPNVNKQAAWRIMTDINNWPNWHADLEYCQLHGPFAVGSHFILKPKGGPKVKIVLTEIVEGKKFTDCTHFLGARMYDTHEMEETTEGLRLTNTLVVKGPLKWLWIKLVAAKVHESVPEENETLATLARNQHG
jgi:hypothetical protein